MKVSLAKLREKIAQKDSGLKFGIDYDTFKDVLLTGTGLAGGAMTGVVTAAVLQSRLARWQRLSPPQ